MGDGKTTAHYMSMFPAILQAQCASVFPQAPVCHCTEDNFQTYRFFSVEAVRIHADSSLYIEKIKEPRLLRTSQMSMFVRDATWLLRRP